MSSPSPVLRVKRLPHGLDLPLPSYATPGSAGMDLRAAVTEPVQLVAGARTLLPTGLALELPAGYEGQVRPRSGLAVRHGLTVLNTPGTIDSDYRGELKVILINLGPEVVTISRGDRIAQLVIAPCCAVRLEETTGLADSTRGTGGFGHTGKN